MKASEVIERLQELIEEHGVDFEVEMNTDGRNVPIDFMDMEAGVLILW